MKKSREKSLLKFGLKSALLVSAASLMAPQLAWSDAGITDAEVASALEERIRMLEDELQNLRNEIDGHGPHAEGGVSQEVIDDMEERVARVERRREFKGSMVAFRGGYAKLRSDRSNQVFSDAFGFNFGGPIVDNDFRNDNDEGWYVGAFVEHSMTRDLFGFVPGVELAGEIGLEYKRWGRSNAAARVVPVAVADLPDAQPPAVLPIDVLDGSGSQAKAVGELTGVTLTMFTVSASPKIKFMEGSKIRPWIIPGGLAFHVISPPSNAGTVLDVGVQFGGGVEYEVMPSIKVGIDGRYNLTADETDGVDNQFWTAGGYLGFDF